MRGVIATPSRGEPGLFASWAKALALAGGKPDQALAIAESMKASPRVIGAIKSPVPAHWTGDEDAAGFEDARFISTQFQAFLRNASLFYRLLDEGMVRVPLRSRVGWTTATATAFVRGEGAAIPVSRMGVEAEGIDREKACALVILTREMLRTAGTAGEALIARELRRAVASEVDSRFVEIIADDVTPIDGTDSGADAIGAIIDLHNLLDAVEPTAESRLVWAMAPDVGRAASLLADRGKSFLFPEMTPIGGTMKGIPAIVTSGMADGTLALIDATGLAGDSEMISVQASDDTTIKMATDPAANSKTGAASENVSMFQTHSTAILATSWFGAMRFRSNAIAIVENVAWVGPPSDDGEE